MPPVPDAAYQAIVAAVKSGRIPQERLDASVRRILQAKARLGLNKNRLVDINELNDKFAKTAWQETAQEISDRGVTLLRWMAPSPRVRCWFLSTPIRSLILARTSSRNSARASILWWLCARTRKSFAPTR